MGLKLSNNASGLLALAISDSDTSLTLEAGHGSRFPALGAGDYFPITVVRASDSSQFEIMRCTARTLDTLTVERAQEGTSALAFDPGDVVELRLTAGTLEEHFPQMEEGDARKLHFSVDTDTQGKPELTVHGENGESTAFALKGELGARDLNAVFEDGLFVQPSDAGALAALNYPAEKAGVLAVKAVAAGVCTQQYFALDGTLYARTATGGSWSQWNRLLVNSMELVASVLGLPYPIEQNTILLADEDGTKYEAKTLEELADALGVRSQVPMFFVAWCPDRNHIWPGYVAADGQQLSSDTYPDASAGITAGAVPTTDDATWLADPTQRGKYVADDGSGYFRVPDYNGRYSGSLGAVYQTGDGHKSAGEAGVIREDQMQGHRHATAVLNGNEANATQGEGDSVSRLGVGTVQLAARNLVLTGPAAYSDAIGGEPRTGDHTHGTDVTGCWVIRLFGTVANPGAADAEQLASDYANLNGAFQALDSHLDFTIIYPNGGTAEAPANVTINSRYVEPNPFPGHHVICIAEVNVGGVWGETGWIYSSSNASGYGVSATEYGDSIVIQTGNGYLGSVGPASGHPFGNTNLGLDPRPCRVKVWKLKGAI